MDKPTVYDPSSPNEQAPPLPSAPLQHLKPHIVLQPPLSRRGTGPGIILLLPPDTVLLPSRRKNLPLDPDPVQKWAEEGFAVVGITLSEPESYAQDVRFAVDIIQNHPNVDIKHKIGLIAYVSHALMFQEQIPSEIACVSVFASLGLDSLPAIPMYVHATTSLLPRIKSGAVTESSYPGTETYFMLPNSATYDPAAAALAHTRNLVFLRKHIGGPHFDIEAVWEEHTYWEFERRSVAQTMVTMVAEPYVNHVPTMTGGMGREQLTAFYRNHFIFCNPPDTALQPVSRTVGPDRVVDEFIFSCTHTSVIPWLLPNVPPTNTALSIPMVGVINVRGDRLYHEHIWWDQATVLRQAGILPTHLPLDGCTLKLPVAGVECAKLLAEGDGKSNEMIGRDWANTK